MAEGTRSLRQDETPSDIARAGYDKSAQRYLDWAAASPWPRVEWMNKLYSKIQVESANVLELGCGAGVPCLQLTAEKVAKLTGVDISSTQLQIAKQKLSEGKSRAEVELVESDMLTLKFNEASFDAIYAIYSIIHLKWTDQFILLERIWRWLKPGGYLLFNVSSHASKNEVEVTTNWLGMDAAFWSGAGSQETQERLKEVGFEIEELQIIDVEGDAEFCWFMARRPTKTTQGI